MTATLDQLFVKVRSENRAALIAYIPAGFPTIEGCKKAITPRQAESAELSRVRCAALRTSHNQPPQY